MASIRSDKYEYQPLGEGEEPQQQYRPTLHERLQRYSFISGLCLFVGLAIGAFAGFFVGTSYAQQHRSCSDPYFDYGPVQLDQIKVTFESNRSYVQHPSPEADAIWEKQYPKDGHGLLGNPDGSDKRVGFAGFHQLHCVDALRHGFYQADDIKRALLEGREPPTFDHNIGKDHTMHCIEFLRQTVLCYADTTMQIEDEYHRGIPAFGSEYQCRDWSQMVAWVDRNNEKFPPPP